MEQDDRRGYSAFISYSHLNQGLAADVQKRVEGFLRTPLGRRRLRVFRDRTSLGAASRLWSDIRANLDAADCLIYVASPAAAQSTWVAKEVSYWLEHRHGARIILLLAEGEIVWDSAQNDFDWAKTTAISPELTARFPEEPLYIDCRSLQTAPQDEWFDLTVSIAAALTRRPKDELIEQNRGDEFRVRRFRAWAKRISATLVVLLLAATAAVYRSVDRSKRVQAERLVGIARERQDAKLSLESLALLGEANALRQTKAVRTASIFFEAPSALLLGQLPYSGAPIEDVANSPDANTIAVASADGLFIWDLPSGRHTKYAVGSISRVQFVGSDLVLLASRQAAPDGPKGKVELCRLPREEQLKQRELFAFQGELVGFSPSGQRAFIYRRNTGTISSVTMREFLAGSWRLYGQGTDAGVNDPFSQTALEAAPSITSSMFAATEDAYHTSIVAIASGSNETYEQPGGGKVNMRAVAEFSDAHRDVAWLKGHADAARAVAFSPDGRHLVSGGDDKSIIVWNGFAQERRLDNGSPVLALAFNPSGSHFASFGADGKLRLWTASGELLQVSIGSHEPVQKIIFSADGHYLFSVGQQEMLVWQIQKLAMPKEEQLNRQIAACATFLAGDSLVAASDSEGDISLYRVDDMWQVGRLTRDKLVEAIRARPGADNAVPGYPTECVGARASQNLFVGSSAGWIARFDAQTHNIVHLYENFGSGITSMALSENEDLLCSAYEDGVLRSLDVQTGRSVKSYSLSGSPKILGIGPRCLSAVFSKRPGSLSVLNIQTGEISELPILDIHALNTRETTFSAVRFSPDESRIAVVVDGHTINVADLRHMTWTSLSVSSSPDPVRTLSFFLDDLLIIGRSSLVTRTSKLMVSAWDIGEARELDQYSLHTPTFSILGLMLDSRQDRLLILAGNAIAFEQGGAQEMTVLGSPLLRDKTTLARAAASDPRSKVATMAIDVLRPDPAGAGFWAALWETTRTMDALLTAYELRTSDPVLTRDALTPLQAWLNDNAGHPYWFEGQRRIELLRRKLAGIKPD